MQKVKDLIEQLPPDLQQEVQDFIEFLIEKKTQRKQKKLRLNWAGALQNYKDAYTSVELQKKALDWWGD
jgi:hypothetical protein